MLVCRVAWLPVLRTKIKLELDCATFLILQNLCSSSGCIKPEIIGAVVG